VVSTSTAGACTISIFSSIGGGGDSTGVGAGAITISGGRVPVMLTPSSASGAVSYASYSDPQPLWTGGETLMVAAAGDLVPAFTASAIAPGAVTITAPAPSATTMMLSRTSDLAVAWTGGGAGPVRVELDFPLPMLGVADERIDCAFDEGAGSGSVPSTALATLPSGAQGSLRFGAGVPQTIMAGPYAITIAILGAASWSGTGNVQLQ
jgi:hypothetical protein